MTEGKTSTPSYVADYLKQIAEKVGEIDCIYRGEPDTDTPLANGAERRILHSLHPMQWEDHDIKSQVLNEIMPGYHSQLLDDARQKGFGLVDGRILHDLELLTELQHLGAATCLLDFTKSALVALYFACSAKPPAGDGKNTGNGKLFIVPSRNMRHVSKETTTSIDGLLAEKDHPLLWQPAIHGAVERRILVQHGIFMIHADKDCESINIRQEDKVKILEELDSVHKISADSLFPDLSGFAKNWSVTTHLNNESTSLYRGVVEQRGVAKQDFNESSPEATHDVTCLESGFMMLEQKKHEEAIEKFNTALQIKPNLAEAFYGRGLTKAILGQPQEAIIDYDEAIRIKPDLAEAFHGRGLAKAMLGQLQEAIKDYDEAIRIKPDFAEAFYGRGLTKAILGQPQEAIRDYDEAIKIKQDYAEAFQYRGLAKAMLRQHHEAIRDYDQAIRIKPDYAIAFHSRGLVKATLGQHQEALRDYDEAIRISPNFDLAFHSRGLCWRDLGDKDKAHADFQRAIELAEQEGNVKLRDDARAELDKLDKSS